MDETCTLGFRVEPFVEDEDDDPSGKPLGVTPLVNGTSLVQLVGKYERSVGFDPAGGYGGIIPAKFDFGALDLYYLGGEARQWPAPDRLWLLGCSCGEVGCWPARSTGHGRRADSHVDGVRPAAPAVARVSGLRPVRVRASAVRARRRVHGRPPRARLDLIEAAS